MNFMIISMICRSSRQYPAVFAALFRVQQQEIFKRLLEGIEHGPLPIVLWPRHPSPLVFLFLDDRHCWIVGFMIFHRPGRTTEVCIFQRFFLCTTCYLYNAWYRSSLCFRTVLLLNTW
ncbi:hypothetical protein KP509_04G029400 [Ceratopteris richardii]|uniref:Uncharacterized protein n=1 Tax=Ceratopteris richardii TaxID=49495 RepID=A0A8T2UYH0_CERRI|nr:hypothetical protein KP509_04G029400 [Ceratopteris richardii]